MKQRYKWFWVIVVLMSFCPKVGYGQYMYGTTGLLQMPTAEMQRDKTFMFGGILPSQTAAPSMPSFPIL